MTQLEVARRQRRWTQTHLSFLTNVPAPEISLYEHRLVTPKTLYLERLSAVLGVPADTLINDATFGPGATHDEPAR